MLKGRIIKNISNAYTVLVGELEYICTPRGKFRKEKITPLVGDMCEFDEKNSYLLKILPRKNELQRPAVSNIDYALLVTSLKQPDYNAYLLDKEIASVLLSNIKPVILFTKVDLLNEEEKKEYQKIKTYYEKLMPCFENIELESILNFLQGSFVVLTGQTGAGKSTFLNNLSPDLNLKTSAISLALNRGKHTTRHSEFFKIQNVYFCDTPGFSSLDILNYSKEELKQCFKDFQKYDCKFQDCMHRKEIGCKVKEAVEKEEILKSRYDSYNKIIEVLENESIRIVSKK